MKKLNKILFISVFVFSFSIFAGNVFAVDTPAILKKCDIVVKKPACVNAVKKCNNDACANKAVADKSVTGGNVVDFCRSANDPQKCNSTFLDKCKQFAGDTAKLQSCANNVKTMFPGAGAGGSAPAGGSNPTGVGGVAVGSASDLPGAQADLNAKGIKYTQKPCGSGDSAVKTQIDLGCRGEGSAIEDLALALVRLLTYGVGIILVGSIIYAGIMYSASTGSPEATQKAKNRIRDAIIALIFYLLIGTLIQFLVPGGLIVVK